MQAEVALTGNRLYRIEALQMQEILHHITYSRNSSTMGGLSGAIPRGSRDNMGSTSTPRDISGLSNGNEGSLKRTLFLVS